MSTYLLYRRADCGDCAIKSRCTEGKGRSVKVPSHTVEPTSPPTVSPESGQSARQDLRVLLDALESCA